MCNQLPCEYEYKCRDCAYNVQQKSGTRAHRKTGLDTSDMKAYKREWMRRKRAADLQAAMEAAGVA
jgi:transposase-like protein